MKRLLLLTFAALSMNSFAQSYLILDNGSTITTDRKGFAYDFGHQSLPDDVSLKGGQYFVEEGNVLNTIDQNGLLFKKYEVIPSAIKGKGNNYFLAANGDFYVIDEKGVLTVSQDEVAAKAESFGGNYFTSTQEEKKTLNVHVVTPAGQVVTSNVAYLKSGDVVSHGGNYFMSNRGVVFTVSSDARVVPRADMRVGVIVKKGGNFFVDSQGAIFTVAEDGELKLPGLPLNLKVTNITRFGANYFLDVHGRFFVVDGQGNINERVMRDHDFRTISVIAN